jgi:hypothetical protein
MDIDYLDIIKKLKGYFTQPEGNVEIGKPEVLKYGATEAPTVDLEHRPEHKMPDGSTATVRSMGINMDGKHALIPTISPKGELWDDDSAVENYRKTNEHMGLYPDDETSDVAGQKIHLDQEKLMNAKHARQREDVRALLGKTPVDEDDTNRPE